MGDRSGGGVLKLVFDGVCSDKSEIPSHMIFQPENKAKINNFFFSPFSQVGTYLYRGFQPKNDWFDCFF